VTSAEGDALAAERRRLAAVSTIAGEVARHVHEFTHLRADAAPRWLTQLGVPAGWQTRHLAQSTVEPSRIAVSGQRPDGGWDGCETITVFGFTGIPPEDVVRDNADRTLRDLAATGITRERVDTSALRGALAVRSSGYFVIAGRWVWAQYSTYVFGSTEPSQGRLIEHTVFIESGSQARLSGDVAELTQAVHQALAANAAEN
jgi:hypothetical protein